MKIEPEELKKTILEIMDENLKTHEFGEFGFTVTMSQGEPVKITEVKTTNLISPRGTKIRLDKRLEVVK